MPSNLVPKGYSKVSFTYDNSKLEGYQLIEKNKTYAADDKVKGSDFYLFYAINEKTGEKAFRVSIGGGRENALQIPSNRLY